MMILDDEQEAAVQRMVNEPTQAALNASGLGRGKTVMAVEVAKRLGARRVLVVGPVSGPVEASWKGTFAGQGVSLPFRRIDATKAGVAAKADLRAGVDGIYYVGREFFYLSATEVAPKVKPDGTMTRGRKKRWMWDKDPIDLTIWDESHVLANRNSNAFKVLKTIKRGYRMAMSATPQGNSFKGIWPTCRWLWPKTYIPGTQRLYVDNSQWRWAAEWAIVEDDFFAGKKIVGEKNPGAFVASLPCYVRLEARESVVNEAVLYVEMTRPQAKMYKQMQDDALAWIEEHPLEAEVPIVQAIRLRQMALGEVTLTEDDEVDFDINCKSPKIQTLKEEIDKGQTMLVLTDSQKFARAVAHQMGDDAYEWSGKTSKTDRAWIMENFGPGKPVRIIVAVIPAVAEGIDGWQHVCNTVVWLNESQNNLLNVQALGRLNRTGQTKPVESYKILTLGTADDGTFQRLAQNRRENLASLTLGGDT